MRKLGIIFKFGCIKIDAVTGLIGIPFFFQRFNQRNLLVNGIGGLHPDIRLKNIQVGHVLLESPGIIFGDVPGSLSFAQSTFFHFILTHIPIPGEMANIGDVHNVLHAITIIHQHPP